ncbi:MAG TPA: PEP-CTERM sorting domain-containing protein, partial [Gemmatimonadaceae bacterium]
LAQTVTFSTAGAFGGAAGCVAAGCTFGNYTLSYIGASSTSYGAPTLVDLGSFSAVCNAVPANGTNCGTSSVPAGATFTLTVTQTTPGSGTQSFTGTLAGAFTFDPTQSSMKWQPSSSVLNIAGVVYTLVTDNSGNINIVAPNPGANPNLTTVKANIVASPEPSTVALMATGIFGLVPLIRRRRK